MGHLTNASKLTAFPFLDHYKAAVVAGVKGIHAFAYDFGVIAYFGLRSKGGRLMYSKAELKAKGG